MEVSKAIWNRFKPVLFAILPIVGFFVIVHFAFYRFETEVFVSFLIGSAIFIVGQVILMVGTEKALVPMGEYVGNSSDKISKFFIILLFGFLFGLFSTVAEPDLQVFAGQAALAGFVVPKIVLIFGAGFGMGIFIALALYRIVSKIPLNVMLFSSYAIIFILAIFVPESSFAIALDAGVTTTGVVTTPFLLALGIGVARVKSVSSRGSSEDSFGVVAMSSLGAVIAVLVLSIIYQGGGAGASAEVVVDNTPLWLEILKNVSLSLIPLIAIFFIFAMIFVKISRREAGKLLLGSLVTFVGCYLFLFGIEYGFVGMGKAFGAFLYRTDIKILTYVICSAFAFFICFSEPAVKVLADQVEKMTHGNIKSVVVIATIGIGVLLAIVLSILRIYYEISLIIYAGIFIGLALILSFFVPKTFTAIAFDSAGAASGSLSVAFLFPIMLGLAGDISIGSAFGVIAMTGITPVVVVQVLGLMYSVVNKIELKRDQRILIKFSRTTDKYSNIDKLERRHNEIIEKGRRDEN